MRFLQLAAKECEDGVHCSDNDCVNMPENSEKGRGIGEVFEKIGILQKMCGFCKIP